MTPDERDYDDLTPRRESEQDLLDRLADQRAETRAKMRAEAIPSALLRMVDFKIPVIWLIGGSFVAVSGVIGMYYKLEKVAENLTELKVTVSAGNLQGMTNAGDMALIRYRVENIEARMREEAARRADK